MNRVAPSSRHTVWRDGQLRGDELAEEVPIAFEYNGISHAVMLATPADLDDFAVGFSLSEGIVARRDDIFSIEIEEAAAGITLKIEIAAGDFMRLKQRRRSLAGRTGCGLCGTESLDQVLRELAPLPAGEPFPLGRAVRRDARAAGAAAHATGDRRHPCRLPRRPRWRDQPGARGRRTPQCAGQDPGRAGARGHRRRVRR
jgi:formate dehydrogenase assembly factor FdhD